MEMNLPAFSSDLILIKNALYQETDARYKGRVVSEAETKGYFSQAFGGKFLKILNSTNIFIFNCSCYGIFYFYFFLLCRLWSNKFCSFFPKYFWITENILKCEKWHLVGDPGLKVLGGGNMKSCLCLASRSDFHYY